MSNTINYGIDLGTTNSAIAVYNNGEVEIFRNPINLKQTLSSVVAFKGDRTIVGDKAKELLEKLPGKVFGGFKRKMGTTETFDIIGTARVTDPIELSSMVLKELKNFIHTKENPKQVVITIPSAFDTIQSNATKQAGLMSGFENIVLLQEPIAASLAFANNAGFSIEEGKWIVYDFGGGTFDVALTSLIDGELKIIDHEGDNFLGGNDFDSLIIDQFIIPEINKKVNIPNLEEEMKRSSGSYNKLYTRLKFIAEEAKIHLSTVELVEIEFDLDSPTGETIEIILELSQSRFEEICIPIVEKTIKLTQQVLDRQNILSSDLQCILLIGGSTYMPLVRRSLEKKFGAIINYSMDPTVAIAVGAAYFAGTRPLKKFHQRYISQDDSEIEVKLAYERVSTKTECLVMSKVSGDIDGCEYRVIRTDNGFDTGRIKVQHDNQIRLTLLSGSYNAFEILVFDVTGTCIKKQEFGITHGKYNVDGQTLPDNICIELDDIELNTTFLEPIFTKNSLLPLKKTIIKQISKTIKKDSDDELVIKLLEGDIDTIPAANKSIGLIKISGKNIDRSLIKGTDVEITFEITESRDVIVEVFVTLTDEVYKDKFSPNTANVDIQTLIGEVTSLKAHLVRKIGEYERVEKYESASIAYTTREEINNILSSLENLSDDDTTDLKYKLDIRKRAVAKQVYQLNNSSYLDQITQDYLAAKNKAFKSIKRELANFNDKEVYEGIINNEQSFLKEGVPSIIKMKINNLDSLSDRISQRDNTKVDIKSLFLELRLFKFKDQQKAQELFDKGNVALNERRDSELVLIVNELFNILNQDDEEIQEFVKNTKTGLK